MNLRNRRVRLASGIALGLFGAVVLACGPAPESQSTAVAGAEGAARAPSSPNPRLDVVEMLREDLATERHPGDGEGRAWLEPIPEPGPAGTPGSWRLVFEVGAPGIEAGGWIFLQVPPFWGWDTPQVVEKAGPGFTRVLSAAEGVELVPRTVDQGLLAIEVTGRPLVGGERVVIEYGIGPEGARRDRYAEHGSSFFVAVDADGDGIRGILSELPTVDVLAGPPARLQLTVPSTAAPEETVTVSLAVLDAQGNAGVPFEGSIEIRTSPGGSLVRRVDLGPEDGGVVRFDITLGPDPVQRFRALGPEGLATESNPVVVEPGPRVLWGDLHGHSQISDGTGTPEDYYRYARDVAALDVSALTDHDHWGLRPLSEYPDLWGWIQQATRRFHEPGSFVTLLGYEWTSWIHGHRHVLYFGDDGEVLSSVDPDYESPEQLWSALRGLEVLTFAHHSAGGPIATNWSVPPDPVLEPVTEIASVHGSSEAADSPRPIYGPISGNWVRDALGRGYRLGFVGSGDSHDGHPGLAQIAGGTGGLAAILSEELSREGVLEALRSRRVYATNGPRILLRAELDGSPMGAVVEAGPWAYLAVRSVAPATIERVDLVRGPEVVRSWPGQGRREIELETTLRDLRPGEAIYVRVVTLGDGAAWSSPFFVAEAGSGS